jgi:hypothetical protein
MPLRNCVDDCWWLITKREGIAIGNRMATDDLPLLANVSQIRVEHFDFEWAVDFEAKSVAGRIDFVLRPTKAHCGGGGDDDACGESPGGDDADFVAIFDCCDIDVESVVEEEEEEQRGLAAPGAEEFGRRIGALPARRPLSFGVDEWTLKVWKQGVKCPCRFPARISVRYRCRPECRSVRWTTDQDGW